MRRLPRDHFMNLQQRDRAYEDRPQSIDCAQTISQPYIVALMTELVCAHNPKKVLEIGTGSGYQAAILSQLVPQVYSIERIEPLLRQAEQRFRDLRLDNIVCSHGDGGQGWRAHAPYEGIIVTSAAPDFPQALLSQLADGGRMVIPVDNPEQGQTLYVVERQGAQYTKTSGYWGAFWPLLPGTA